MYRPNTFEVVGVDGTSSGKLLCQSSTELIDWLKVINSSVATLNAQSVSIETSGIPATTTTSLAKQTVCSGHFDSSYKNLYKIKKYYLSRKERAVHL